MLHWYVATSPVTPLVREIVPFVGAVSVIPQAFATQVGGPGAIVPSTPHAPMLAPIGEYPALHAYATSPG
ncbi:MAG: hypothetical protein KF901_19165 [Myxococcales bacterium]|nr:hypothetical protein [Myxococcales bacterium]